MHEVRISAALMHHPARAAAVSALAEACQPIDLQVISDPDPTGFPSPLRTAKLAWSAVLPGATHHLVLQDDVTLSADFAATLAEMVTCLPDHGIALYVCADSPQNSYLTRLAVAAGSSWAPLSEQEWTPAQGLVLPAPLAKELADWLCAIPDEVRDDDEMIVVFCRERGVPVVAAIPGLVEHGDARSLAGHESHGDRRAVVLDTVRPPAGHWRPDESLLAGLTTHATFSSRTAFAVELRRSRCLLRFLRPGSDEPVEHPFGWYWHDWCWLVGVDAERVLASERSHRHVPASVAPPVASELWAAGYLLGAASAAHRRAEAATTDLWDRLLRHAMRTWVDSGVSPSDLLEPEAREALVAHGCAAVAAGRRDGSQTDA